MLRSVRTTIEQIVKSAQKKSLTEEMKQPHKILSKFVNTSFLIPTQ